MSDRRPEKPAFEIVAESMYQVPGSVLLEYREMKRDPVAAVRRGVEDGSIEGEEYEVTMVEIPKEQGRQTYRVQTPIMVPPGTYLVIPVDGEENG